MNVESDVNRGLRLYDCVLDLMLPFESIDLGTIKITNMITNKTTCIEFDKFVEKFPGYNLMKVGPDTPCGKGGASLGKSITYRNFILSKHLIRKMNANEINMLCVDNRTPLILTIFNRCMFNREEGNEEFELMYQLILSGSDVNLSLEIEEKVFFHVSPLSLALECSDIRLVRLLLNFGAKKQYRFSEDKKNLIKQAFRTQEDAIYKAVKREMKIIRYQFLSGHQCPNSIISWLPENVVSQILKCNYDFTVTPYSERIREAKKLNVID